MDTIEHQYDTPISVMDDQMDSNSLRLLTKFKYEFWMCQGDLKDRKS